LPGKYVVFIALDVAVVIFFKVYLRISIIQKF